MKRNTKNWKSYWNSKSPDSSDNRELDRGTNLYDEDMERYSESELLSFLNVKEDDLICDAGCGTGKNISTLGPKAKVIIGIDYSKLMIDRCKKRIKVENISNARLIVGSLPEIALRDDIFDKAVCMSVFQYLSDNEIDDALKELVRVSKDGAVIVFHVKNLSSLYLFTLYLAKKTKSLFKNNVKIEYYRGYNWYKKTLAKHGMVIVDYNSVNKFSLDFLPAAVKRSLQRIEFICYKKRILRKVGSELKIKAIIRKASHA